MVPRNNKGYGFIKKRTKTKESTFISDIPGLEDFHLDRGRQNSAAQFKESILELAKHVVQAIDYDGNKLAASIQNRHIFCITCVIAETLSATSSDTIMTIIW